MPEPTLPGTGAPEVERLILALEADARELRVHDHQAPWIANLSLLLTPHVERLVTALRAALVELASLRKAMQPWAETARKTRERHTRRSPCSCNWCYLADVLDGLALASPAAEPPTDKP